MISKVFKSGNSQAIRIPRKFQLSGEEVEIFKRGDELVIRPLRGPNAAALFDALVSFEGEIAREDVRFQERDPW